MCSLPELSSFAHQPIWRDICLWLVSNTQWCLIAYCLAQPLVAYCHCLLKLLPTLPRPLTTAYQTLLGYVPFTFWEYCPVNQFWTISILPNILYFSHLIENPTLKAFLGLPGMWVLDLAQPQWVFSFCLRSLYGHSLGQVLLPGTYFLSMESTRSRLTHYVPVSKLSCK